MMSRTQQVRTNTTVVATIAAAIALAATVFAPAGFGRNLSATAFWDDEPILIGMPSTVAAGQDVNFDVAFGPQPEVEESDQSAEATPSASAAVSDTRNVVVYSNPPGAISYTGTVTGPRAVIPAHVAADAAPGTVTIFIRSNGSTPATATTTVTNGE